MKSKKPFATVTDRLYFVINSVASETRLSAVCPFLFLQYRNNGGANFIVKYVADRNFFRTLEHLKQLGRVRMLKGAIGANDFAYIGIFVQKILTMTFA